MADFDPSICFLFDNGSRRSASTLSLRGIARRLQDRLAVAVKPVSLLHSSAVDPTELEGRAAELLEPALDHFGAIGGRDAVLLPLFFGPSAALTEYVPERLAALRTKHPQFSARLAPPLISLVDDSAKGLAVALADRVRGLATGPGIAVILVDHGSPQPPVTAVRNRIGLELDEQLRGEVRSVMVASMERRPGPEFAFNDPLLESALAAAAAEEGVTDIVVAMQFLQPGRHAGPGGDVAEICQRALASVATSPRLHVTPLLGDSDTVISLLQRRWQDALVDG